jgi:hypothetical protein
LAGAFQLLKAGVGTKVHPYQITTAAQLAKVATDQRCTHNSFVLQRDIDMKDVKNFGGIGPMNETVSVTWQDGSRHNVPLTSDVKNWFSGDFNGNNHTISNLVTYCGGLFTYIRNASIRNLTLKNSRQTVDARVVKDACPSEDFGIVANVADRSSFTNVSVAGAIRLPWNTAVSAGGIVGVGRATAFRDVHFSGSITRLGEPSYAAGGKFVGGIAGVVLSRDTLDQPSVASLTNVSSSGILHGELDAGGLVGKLFGNVKINDSYARNVDFGDFLDFGAIWGAAAPDGAGVPTVTNVYAANIISHYSEGDGCGIGLDVEPPSSKIKVTGAYTNFKNKRCARPVSGSVVADAALKKQATYSGWNFVNVWKMGASGYPDLR